MLKLFDIPVSQLSHAEKKLCVLHLLKIMTFDHPPTLLGSINPSGNISNLRAHVNSKRMYLYWVFYDVMGTNDFYLNGGSGSRKTTFKLLLSGSSAKFRVQLRLYKSIVLSLCLLAFIVSTFSIIELYSFENTKANARKVITRDWIPVTYYK